MPALRQSVRRRRFWIYCIVAVGLAAVAMSDWLKPAQAQTSVLYYNRAIETLYRGHIHQYTSRYVRCRFLPSCSGYSIMAMQVYGFPKGLWLTVKRICRCTPWVPNGTVDLLPMPVPPKLQPTAAPPHESAP